MCVQRYEVSRNGKQCVYSYSFVFPEKFQRPLNSNTQDGREKLYRFFPTTREQRKSRHRYAHILSGVTQTQRANTCYTCAVSIVYIVYILAILHQKSIKVPQNQTLLVKRYKYIAGLISSSRGERKKGPNRGKKKG